MNWAVEIRGGVVLHDGSVSSDVIGAVLALSHAIKP
jgi:hypothetical protein